MNCERVESLLAAFTERDLTPADDREVRDHLAACPACRESLAAYRALDEALALRRDEVPPVGGFAAAAMRAARVAFVPSRARVIMDRVFSFPAIASFLLVMIGFAGFVYRDAIQGVAGGTSAPSWLSQMAAGLSGMLGTASGSAATMDMWVVSAVYAGVTILILLSTTMLAFRFAHDR